MTLTDQKYILLKKQNLRPSPASAIKITTSVAEFGQALATAPDIVGYDLETKGLVPWEPGNRIVGIGIDTGAELLYLNLYNQPDNIATACMLLNQAPTVAFNAMFDALWLYWYTLHHSDLRACAWVWFKLMANEGWPGQSHSLKTAQADVLGYPQTNKDRLQELLDQHGLKPADMWQLAELESVEFGQYCAWDAQAARQLYQVLDARTNELQLPCLKQYATQEWPNEIQLLIENSIRGIEPDVEALAALGSQLRLESAMAYGKFTNHPKVAKLIKAWERDAAIKFYKPTISTARIKAKANDQPHPDAGWEFQPSAAKSLKKHEQAVGGYWFKPEDTIEWPDASKPRPRFNIGSSTQLKWLFYDAPDALYRWRPVKGRNDIEVDIAPDKTIVVQATGTGQPPTGKKILPSLGEFGKLLTEFNKAEALETTVQAIIESTRFDGALHPEIKPAYTKSGRCSGGKEE